MKTSNKILSAIVTVLICLSGVSAQHYPYYLASNEKTVSNKFHMKSNSENEIISFSKSYYEEGELKEVITLVNNTPNGPFKEFYQNGRVKWRGTYENGRNEIGTLDSLGMNGKILKRMECGKYLGEYVCQTSWTYEGGEVKKHLRFDKTRFKRDL